MLEIWNNLVVANKEWLFSGIGGTILIGIVGFFLKNKDGGTKVIAKKNSVAINAGRDVNYSPKNKEEK